MTEGITRLAAALADRYRLERELGQGGMATVYLAEDLKHDRKVAVKVLRPELAAVLGAERFVQEIKTTAALSHPHILPLFDSGEAGGFLYYVMPYIEGETVREKLNRETQLGIAEAVRITSEVADALDYAHRNGVIHRDIKPENILLHDGRPMVMDFGIALAVSAAAGGRMTETGLSLGTPHYMSPEQATADKQITARSDVYSLASVLYEMLAGEPPHTGGSAQAIMMKIIAERVQPVTELRSSVPPNVAAALAKALEKLPADRFESARAFAGALHDPGFRHTYEADAGAPTAAPRRRSHDPVFLGVACVAVIGVGAALWSWQRARTAAAAAPQVYDVALPDSAPMNFAAFTPYGSPGLELSLSPDGSLVVYLVKRESSTMLWRRSLRDTMAAPFQGTEGASKPRLSPAGSQVAYVAHASLMIVATAGGQPRAIADIEGDAYTLNWITATTLMVVDGGGTRFRRIDLDAGTIDSRSVPVCLDGSWIPDGEQLLCNARGVGRIVDPATGTSWTIRTRTAAGSPSGPLAGTGFNLVDGRYLVYQSPQGDLRAAPYDPSTHTVGRSASLLTGVRSGVGSANYDLAPTGTLVFTPGANSRIGELVELSPGGATEPLGVPAAAYERWDLTRDRRWLAAVVEGPGFYELQIINLRGGQSFTWLRAAYVDQPLWGADDSTLIVQVRDSTGAAILRGGPSSARAPDTVFASRDAGAVPVLLDWSVQHQALGALGEPGTPRLIVGFDPLARTVRFDSIASDRIYAVRSLPMGVTSRSAKRRTVGSP
jgi:serine/threonine-protein kinase